MREEFSHCQESREAELNSRIIAIKLQAFEPVIGAEETASSSSNEPKRGHFFTTTTGWGTQIGFYKQIIAYDVPDRHKAVARLDRGRLFPVVSAASGWRTDFAVEHVPSRAVLPCGSGTNRGRESLRTVVGALHSFTSRHQWLRTLYTRKYAFPRTLSMSISILLSTLLVSLPVLPIPNDNTPSPSHLPNPATPQAHAALLALNPPGINL